MTSTQRLGSALVAACWVLPAAAQQAPLAPVRESGQSVTPVFEGWYRNPDGTHSLSFGYFNRNATEELDIPIGSNNFIEPGDPNQGQAAHFSPRRHWGVFAVTVPANFGTRRVVWTLVARGQTFSIAGSLKRGWEIDALEGEAGSDNTPPVLRFDPAGPVALTWFKHQGPGDVTFSDPKPPVDPADGKATTTATFSAPGDYLLRLRANDASGVSNAGHAQCCWTNGFVKVRVTR